MRIEKRWNMLSLRWETQMHVKKKYERLWKGSEHFDNKKDQSFFGHMYLLEFSIVCGFWIFRYQIIEQYLCRIACIRLCVKHNKLIKVFFQFEVVICDYKGHLHGITKLSKSVYGRLGCLERFINFLWMVCKGCLPTTYALSMKHVDIDVKLLTIPSVIVEWIMISMFSFSINL